MHVALATVAPLVFTTVKHAVDIDRNALLPTVTLLLRKLLEKKC
jgi:hypothetical protein